MKPFLEIITPLANANFFLSILLIGSMLRVDIGVNSFSMVAKFVLIRIGFTVFFAIIMYLVLPYDNEIRLAVVLASCSPISMLSTLYTEKCGGDSSMAGFTYSINVLTSIVMMFFVLSLF